MLQEYLRRIGLLLGGLAGQRHRHHADASGQYRLGALERSPARHGQDLRYYLRHRRKHCRAQRSLPLPIFCGESFGLGTLANIFVCPIFIDILLYLNWVPLFERFSTGLAALLIGMELLALGTWMYMKSTLGSGPRDALMVVLARKTHRTVGLCRAAVEVVIVWIGWRLGGQVGIGTIVAAVGVGSLFNLNFALLRFNPALLHQENLPETLQRFRERKTIT